MVTPSLVEASELINRKTMNALATPAMYRDCVVNNTTAFLKAVKQGQPYDQIERLQIYFGTTVGELRYAELLARGWTKLQIKTGPSQTPPQPDVDKILFELKTVPVTAQEVRRLAYYRADVLPNLRQVVLGGLGECNWNSREAKALIAYGGVSMHNRSAAHLLLGLPSVEHFCQYYKSGPLSLSGEIIKLQHPLKTFHYHARTNSPHSLALEPEPEQPPIIIGATNRYFFDKTTYAFAGSHVATDGRHQCELLHAVLDMLCPRRTRVLVSGLFYARSSTLDQVDLTGTVIEIYELVRLVNKTHHTETEVTARSSKYWARPPQSLAELQSALDAHIHPAWRGKVFLRYREDAPPCSACGFDINEEWKQTLGKCCPCGKVQMLGCPGHW